jgi:hypothetical protein
MEFALSVKSLHPAFMQFQSPTTKGDYTILYYKIEKRCGSENFGGIFHKKGRADRPVPDFCEFADSATL